jgi:isoleucyl-tRNA synthetase
MYDRRYFAIALAFSFSLRLKEPPTPMSAPENTTTSPENTAAAALAKQYKATLCLPQTTFPMRAGAITREPELQAQWAAQRIYEQVMHRRRHAPKFVLHDGPPYLSSDKIHIGTALNKILKDIVTRYKSAQGFYSPYVPGYDGHGLPIEAAVEKSIKGGRKSVTPLELREKCRAFAKANVTGQETNFKRLGVWGNWGEPYLTIDGSFEATQIRLFAEMYEKGFVYKGLKPVYWCPVSETALAEAEIEYADHVSHSIYVKFALPDTVKAFGEALPEAVALQLLNASLLIWTTTPWTLPSNVAIAVNPSINYVVLQKTNTGEKLVVAEALKDNLLQILIADVESNGWEQLGASFEGRLLEGLNARHPFIGRKSVVLLGEHVTTEAGTGLVHTAPGHGPDDFVCVQKYNRSGVMPEALPILSPIDSQGRMTHETWLPESLKGQFYEQGNGRVIDLLKTANALLFHKPFTHSYPHSWRSHAPVIFRATEQWFINMDGFRKEALQAVDETDWVPKRGKNRIYSMVEGRLEWCVSRQRIWGVPIPAFYCNDCGKVHLSKATTEKVAERFKLESSDAWVKYTANELLGEDYRCECGSASFRKEEDIMDVWFDSGVTHTAVVEARKEELGELPVELYLEGSDQHRGWFQSSLLTSVMLRGKAPYKTVLTHGFVLDENGRKMSKSLGNVIDPNTVMKQFGADVLRLWVASVDYSGDVRIGDNTLKQLADIYRKIRNTARFMLGNLHGFDPAQHSVPYKDLDSLDRYVLHRLQNVVQAITDAFDKYEFYRFYQVLQNFCVVELSSLYFDVVKDILYCNAENDLRRRAVQTVLYEALSVLTRLIVPVMPHLAEDIWHYWPQEQRSTFGEGDVPTSILLSPWPQVKEPWLLNETQRLQFESLLSLREKINLALEEARSNDKIGSALEARVCIQPLAEEWAFLKDVPQSTLETLFLISQVELLPADASEEALAALDEAALGAYEEGDDLRLWALPPAGDKCQRCWKFTPEVGTHAEHEGLCTRCHSAVVA